LEIPGIPSTCLARASASACAVALKIQQVGCPTLLGGQLVSGLYFSQNRLLEKFLLVMTMVIHENLNNGCNYGRIPLLMVNPE